MSLSRRITGTGLLGLILILAGPPAHADLSWSVSLDTSQLTTDYTGPFALDFELTGSNGNTVTLNNFSFGGGSAGPGSAVLTGGASGDLGSSVLLTDSTSFFSDFNQQFTPGSTLTFTMTSTLVAPPGSFPDNFSMVILENYTTANGYNFISNPPPLPADLPIYTPDPTGGNTFFNFNINGPGSTTVSTYSSEVVFINVTPMNVVPEPPTSLAVLFALAGLGMWRWRRTRVKP